MNQSPTMTIKTSIANHKVKLIVAFSGLLMMFTMSACLCVGMVALLGSESGTPTIDRQTYEDYATGSAVFVNGVELSSAELYALESVIGQVQPGRYWLDNQGYFGYEGGPAQGNLYVLAGQQSGDGNSGYYNSPDGSLYFGSDGDSSYFFDSDTGCSVVGGEVSC